MGTHRRIAELRAQRRSEGGDVSGRHTRTGWSLPVFAIFAVSGLVAVSLPPAQMGTAASTAGVFATGQIAAQSLRVDGAYETGVGRDAFSITDPPPPPEPETVSTVSGAPAAGTPDPGTAQAIAYDMVMGRGWGQGEYDCLVSLWNRESHWNVYAHNSSSGAYGIPQALPGEKMASAGADWATNPATQITWGLGYITGRYGTPCGAWAASEEKGWY